MGSAAGISDTGNADHEIGGGCHCGVILMKDHGLVEMVLAILAVYCLLNALV